MEVLVTVAAVITGGGAIGWLVKLFVSRGLDVLAKSHNERMKLEHAERLKGSDQAHLERMASIQAEHQQELEAFKSKLGNAAHEVQTRTTVLVSKQATVIAKLYRLLVIADREAKAMVRFGRIPKLNAQNLKTTLEAVNTAIMFNEEHLVFLPWDVADKTRSWVQLLREPTLTNQHEPDKWSDIDFWRKLKKKLEAEAPPAKVALENRLRELLGVAKNEDDAS